MRRHFKFFVFLCLLLIASVLCCSCQKQTVQYRSTAPKYWSWYKAPAYDMKNVKDSFVITLSDILEKSGDTMENAGRIPPTFSEEEWLDPINTPYIKVEDCAFVDGKLYIPVFYGYDMTHIPDPDAGLRGPDVDECVRIIEIDYETGSVGETLLETTARSDDYDMYWYVRTCRGDWITGEWLFRFGDTGPQCRYYLQGTNTGFSIRKYDMETEESMEVLSRETDKIFTEPDRESGDSLLFYTLIREEDYILYELQYSHVDESASRPDFRSLYVFFRIESEEVFMFTDEELKAKLAGASGESENVLPQMEEGFFYQDTFYLANGQTLDLLSGEVGTWGTQYLGDILRWIKPVFQKEDLLFLKTHDEEGYHTKILNLKDENEITEFSSLAQPSAADGNDIYDITYVVCAVIQNKVYYYCRATNMSEREPDADMPEEYPDFAYAFCEYDISTGESRLIVDLTYNSTVNMTHSEISTPYLLICGELYCVIFDNTLYCGKMG